MSKYLAVFLLPKPQREHAQLKEAIRDISDGDYKQAFIAPGVIAYLYTSNIPAHELGFSQIVLNGDSYLIVEVGESFSHVGLGVAWTWLHNHRLKR